MTHKEITDEFCAEQTKVLSALDTVQEYMTKYPGSIVALHTQGETTLEFRTIHAFTVNPVIPLAALKEKLDMTS